MDNVYVSIVNDKVVVNRTSDAHVSDILSVAFQPMMDSIRGMMLMDDVKHSTRVRTTYLKVGK